MFHQARHPEDKLSWWAGCPHGTEVCGWRWVLVLALTFLVCSVHAAPAPLTVSGAVTTPEGEALAAAEVALVAMDSNFAWGRRVLAGEELWPRAVVAETDAAGRFVLAAPELGVWRLVVQAEGFVPMRYYPLPLANPVALPPLVLPRDVGTRLSVQDEAGQPVAGAWIFALTQSRTLWRQLAQDGWSVGSRIGRTDAGGNLVLPRARGEQLEVNVFAGGAVIPLQARAVEAVARLRLTKPAAHQRWLEIRHGDGRPAAGVLVSTGLLAWPAGITGADGRLSLAPRLGGEGDGPLRLHIFTDGGQRMSATLEPRRDGRAAVTRIDLPASQPLRGRVMAAATRRPVFGALVWPGHDPGSFVRSDGEGRYTLLTPPGERFWLQANQAGYLPRAETVVRDDVEGGRAPTLMLAPAADLQGQVVDGEGKPLAEAHLAITALPPTRPAPAFRPDGALSRGLSDEAGRFVLSALERGGHYALRASKAGFVTAEHTFNHLGEKAQASPLRLVLHPARAAFGRVLDSAEKPITGAVIEVWAMAEDPVAPPRRIATSQGTAEAITSPFRTQTDDQGRFALTALPGAKIDLAAARRGYAPLTVRGVAVPPGEGPADLGTLILVPGVVQVGKVTDARGEPVAEAEVWALEDKGQTASRLVSASPARPPDATTAADGRFEITDLRPAHKLHLKVDAAGWLPAAVMGIEAPTPQPISVVLRRSAAISGRVIDEDGAAIGAAEIRLRPQEAPAGTVGEPMPEVGSTQWAISDEQGRFHFDEVVPGELEMEALAEGFQPSPLLPLRIGPGEAREAVELVVARGAVLAGLVTTTAGEPVADARLRVGRRAASSDAEGRYRVGGLATGPGILTVRHPELNDLSREVEIESGINNLDLALAGGWRLAGRAVDQAGRPLEGVRVTLRRSGVGEPGNHQTLSDTDGRFAAPRVADGPYGLSAEKEGYARLEVAAAAVVDGAPVEDLEITLEHGVTVSGQVLGLDFEDLARVAVRAESESRGSQQGSVDYEGAYRIADLGPGDWWLQAALRDGSRQVKVRVTLEPGMEELHRDLELREGLTLRGEVRLGEEPLPGTSVAVTDAARAVNRSVVTDHQGRFQMADLEPGNYGLAVSNHRQGLVHNEELALYQDRDIVVRLQTTRISGRVLSAASGEPIADALVAWQRLVGADGHGGSLITVGTSPQGTFTLARINAGHYQARVRAPGFEPVEETVEVVASVDRDDLTFQLTPSAGLELDVRLASGKRPALALVNVRDAEGRQVQATILPLDPAGRARLSTLPAGRWQLMVGAPGGGTVHTTATVPGEPLALALPDAGILTVRVPELFTAQQSATVTLLDPAGRPFQNLDLNALPAGQWPLVAGRTTVESVPAGVWVVSVVAADGSTWQQTVSTAGQAETVVTFE